MWPETKPEWIAETEFDLAMPKDREPTRATARIGRPVLMPAEGTVSEYACCPVAVVPITASRWVGGNDEFQALCLAIEFIRNVLRGHVAGGGLVYFPGTDSQIDVDSPSFVPLADRTRNGDVAGPTSSSLDE